MAAAQSLENDTWVIWNGDVYDVSNFLAVHPGGKDLILRYGGKDITCIMESTDIHKHSATAYSLFKEFKILKLKKVLLMVEKYQENILQKFKIIYTFFKSLKHPLHENVNFFPTSWDVLSVSVYMGKIIFSQDQNIDNNDHDGWKEAH
eukprot:gene19310-21234_t